MSEPADNVIHPGADCRADLPPDDASPETTGTEVDRRGIRKARAEAHKRAKRVVRLAVEQVRAARPTGSLPADQILRQAVELYRDGPIDSRRLKEAISRLEVNIRRGLPDIVVQRAPRSVSARPERVGLMVYETRAVGLNSDRIISAESHSVVLETGQIIFISGLLPSGTRPHLFERLLERGGRMRTMSEVQLRLSTVWPTLLWMRTEQRLQGRGSPIPVMMTPFADGLLFGSLEKVVGLPPAGPTVAVVSSGHQQTRQLRDYYGDANGNRIWAATHTYVDGTLLAPEQLRLRDELRRFVRAHGDVIADNDWRWRIGLGERDSAVLTTARTFRLNGVSEAQQAAALADLETIVASDLWQSVAASSLLSQQQRREKRQERQG